MLIEGKILETGIQSEAFPVPPAQIIEEFSDRCRGEEPAA